MDSLSTQFTNVPRSRRVLGRYELLEEIASGGMATVYLGRALAVAGFQRLVAVKCCHAHLRKDPQFVAMFLDEARLAAQIHHPNVVATLDIDDGEELYLVMEYVEGGRLTDVIEAARNRGERIPVPVALRVMIDALAGLDAAHELTSAEGEPLGIVHRDVSPQNILVGLDGVARLADFGIAKVRSELRATVTGEGELKGKLAYMAPEQLTMLSATRQADVWAAGVVCWELLAGRRLFTAGSDPLLLERVLSSEIARPSSIRDDLPAGLDQVVLRALERNPLERYATAAEFAEALEALPVAPATVRELRAYARDALGDATARHKAVLRALGAADSLPPPPRDSQPQPAARRAGVGAPGRTERRPPPSPRALALGALLAVAGVVAATAALVHAATHARAAAQVRERAAVVATSPVAPVTPSPVVPDAASPDERAAGGAPQPDMVFEYVAGDGGAGARAARRHRNARETDAAVVYHPTVL